METKDDGYGLLSYSVSAALGAPEYRLEAKWRDITRWGEDATTWHVLEGSVSFRVTVTGRAASTSVHPLPPTEALKLAVLFAVRDESRSILRSNGKLDPGMDYPVTVTREHLSQGEEQATRLAVREDDAR